jgi:cystathionine beta-lyase/cystathionine gamma-synthase
MNSKHQAAATHCVHAGEDRHGRNAPLVTAIEQTAVFALKNVEQLERHNRGDKDVYIYTRMGNPTVRAAEEKIATLEGAEDCVVTASGMAAEHAAALAVCQAGDEIVSLLDVYGGTSNLFKNVLTRCGIKTRFVPFDQLSRIGRYFTKKTRMLFLETPVNPTMRCVDIAALAAEAHRRGIVVVVDNTFATPILQKPLALGADIVVHSATKYLGGHSDLTAGAVVASKEWIGKIRPIVVLTGANSDATIAWLLLRGMKTLELRVERAGANAQKVAEFLAAHPRVQKVFFPGLPDSPDHALASRQMSGFGMMVSFDIKGGGRAARKFIDALRLWYLAPSLGGVESTVSYPKLASHVSYSAAELAQVGVSEATIRLSVGIEDAQDLLADFAQALKKSALK